MRGEEDYTFNAVCVKETDKAYLFGLGVDGEEWIPKSLVKDINLDRGAMSEVTIPRWKAEELGWV